jgi:hypothetical protein
MLVETTASIKASDSKPKEKIRLVIFFRSTKYQVGCQPHRNIGVRARSS